MPTILASRPALRISNSTNAIPTRASVVSVEVPRGSVEVRMPSVSAFNSACRSVEGDTFSLHTVCAENIQVNAYGDDGSLDWTMNVNGFVSRNRNGRRLMYSVQPSDADYTRMNHGDAESTSRIQTAFSALTAALNSTPLEWVSLGTIPVNGSLNLSENHALFQVIYRSVANYDFNTVRETINGHFQVPSYTTSGLRTFGIEIEVDFPNDLEHGNARTAVARALYNAGLSQDSQVNRWHYAARARRSDGTTGYTTARNAWSVELDSSVDGVGGQRGCEIVSPILTDTVEVWEDVAKVISIIKDHGGAVTTRTGLHVNIGTSDMTLTSAVHLLADARRFDDVMVRIAHSDETGSYHRGREYCAMPWLPDAGSINDLTASPYSYFSEDLMENNGHRSAINITHMEHSLHNRSRSSSRAEFRIFDGTLETGRIQAYVMLCMAMVNIANAGIEVPSAVVEPSGTHVGNRTTRSARVLSGEDWQGNNVRVREFIDRLRLSEEAAKAIVAMYRKSRWMRNR